MNIFESIILGIVQGLTEFLPVSSSGHLVLVKEILGVVTPGLLFEVVLHAGTLLAILVYFFKEICKLDKKTVSYILIGTVPAGFVGYLFSSQIENLFSSVKLVGISLIITGLINLFVDRINKKKTNLTGKKSFVVGMAQAFAIIPGISRSGSTIFAGSMLGVERKEIAKFSFLLSVPAVLGANLLEIFQFSESLKIDLFSYTTGFLFSFISGFFAIRLVFKLLEEKKFKYFAYYCFFVGMVAILV